MLCERQWFDDRLGGWAIWQMTEPEAQLLPLCASTCAPCPYTNNGRRLEYYAVRALLAEVLGKDKEVTYLPSGKPVLTDHSYQISISHTKGYCALAWHATHGVGVDVEQRSERVSKVAHRFVSPSEQHAVDRLPSADVLPCQLLLWSAKEAAYKLCGHPSTDFQTDILVDIPDRLEPSGESRVHCREEEPFERSSASIASPLESTGGASYNACRLMYRFYPEFVFALCLDPQIVP